MRGTVKFFNLKRGFGFITLSPEDGGSEVYFNKASLRRDREYDPVEGDVVSLEVREAHKGKFAHRIEMPE